MEFQDIIYLVLLVFFMILGFFNDSRKKRDKQKQQAEKPPRPYIGQPAPPFFETSGSEWEEEDEVPSWFEPKPADKAAVVPPAPTVVRNEEGKSVFQSSMDLTTDFAKESSLKGSIFVYDADVSYDKDADAMDISEMSDSYLQKTTAGDKKRNLSHPLLGDLYGDASRKELIKGLIIGEILQRKY